MQTIKRFRWDDLGPIVIGVLIDNTTMSRKDGLLTYSYVDKMTFMQQ